MELPVNGNQKSNLILVDLLGVKSRDLAPSPSRVVSILEILGSQDQGREEHAAATLKCTIGMAVIRLLSGKVMLGNMGLNENQVVQGDLEGRVASP